ncbi:hypothetical protein [Chondromyces crocatus]|nr:hypothetical protein [Chondromyces crocatus]
MTELLGHAGGRRLEVMSLQEAIAIMVVRAKAALEPAFKEIGGFGHV